MKAIKAVYTFIVGDMIILVGVLITLILLFLIENITFLTPLRVIAGALLIIAVLAVLTATLRREVPAVSIRRGRDR